MSFPIFADFLFIFKNIYIEKNYIKKSKNEPFVKISFHKNLFQKEKNMIQKHHSFNLNINNGS